jgi:uncharacterized membrane protein YraQ (UPF0718 family)
LICGFIIPFVCGLLGNAFGGGELKSPYTLAAEQKHSAAVSKETGEEKPIVLRQTSDSLKVKVFAGFKWGFQSLGLEVCRWASLGMVFAAVLLLVVPVSLIQNYLSDAGMVSLVGAVILGAIMYVCALGHIPFIAALVASGAAPGVAIAFLLSGVATNLPEIISIGKLIGKRTIIIYTGTIVLLSLIAGYLTNILLSDFIPLFDVSSSQTQIDLANILSFAVPPWVESVCAFAILLMSVYAWLNIIHKQRTHVKKRQGAPL